jgi:hypothetical protein
VWKVGIPPTLVEKSRGKGLVALNLGGSPNCRCLDSICVLCSEIEPLLNR